ncbi:succinate dehydrogenase assembly factor 2 [Gammaproteobacteria bacterium]|nr:succinate dehydrogenase assembly factor 2 [Gammaproteobacteria bacterium]
MTDLKKKILWQCRRGLWELDQILLPFVENDFEHLNKEDQLLFQKLLQYEDIELFDIFVNKIDPIDNEFRDLTVLIIDKHMKNQNGF